MLLAIAYSAASEKIVQGRASIRWDSVVETKKIYCAHREV